MADFLAPLGAPPAYDDDLEDQIQATIVGITGLDGTLVRPRWQPKPPTNPPRDVTWCAVGPTDITSDGFADTVHDSRGDGSDTVYRGEEITVLASFYGPLAQGYAGRLRDGFAVQQNRAALLSLGLAFARPGTVRNASGLVNAENYGRYDFDFVVRRRVARTYAVPNIRSIDGLILSTDGSPQGPEIGATTLHVR